MRKIASAAGCLALIALITWLARRQGLGISLGLYHLIPVLLGTWTCGRAVGYGLSLLGAGLSLSSLEIDADDLARAQAYWEALMQLGVSVSFTLLLSSLREALERERALARADPLTGAANARAFRESLASEIARARRGGRPLTLAYLDLDRFKEVNDRHGHQAGDELLQGVVSLIREHLRVTDLLARLGGDEFALLLPETGRDGARQPLERLRTALQARMQTRGFPVSVSIGAATFLRPPISPDEAIRKADDLLYAAKRAGKDRLMQEEIP